MTTGTNLINEKKAINCILCASKQEINTILKKEIRLKNRYFSIEVVRCLNCGLVFDCSDIDSIELDNYISNNYYKEKKIGSHIDNRFHRHFTNRALLHIKLIFDFFPANFTGKVLDIGCGAGIFLDEMRKLGWEAHGVEPSQDQYLHAQNILNLNVYNGLFEEYQNDIKFDLIYMSHIFDDLPNIRQAILQIIKSLSNEGLVFIEVPNFFRKNNLDINNGDFIENCYYFTPETLVSILERNGLKIEYINTYEPIYLNTFLHYLVMPIMYFRRFFIKKKNKSHIRVICKKN